MPRTALLAASLLVLSVPALRAEEPAALSTWQVEAVLPAACAAASLPARDCLCVVDVLERYLDRAAPVGVTPVGVTGDGQSSVMPREGSGYALDVALRACRPVATVLR